MLEKQHMARPSKFTAEAAHTAATLAKLGFSDERMAAAIGISRSTLHEWRQANPEFSDAIKTAKSQADAEVVEALHRRACGYIAKDGSEIPPHPTAAIFWLRNRQPTEWRDVTRTELSGPDGGPIQAAPVLQLPAAQDEALQRLIADAQARVRRPSITA